MRFRDRLSGSRFSVVALELDNGSCPAIEYLTALEQRDNDSYTTLLRRIQFRADILLITNKMISRPLKGDRYRGISRLLAKGERLNYCFVAGGRVVLLNGYNKNDNETSAYETARRYLIDLEAQLSKGDST